MAKVQGPGAGGGGGKPRKIGPSHKKMLKKLERKTNELISKPKKAQSKKKTATPSTLLAQAKLSRTSPAGAPRSRAGQAMQGMLEAASSFKAGKSDWDNGSLFVDDQYGSLNDAINKLNKKASNK